MKGLTCFSFVRWILVGCLMLPAGASAEIWKSLDENGNPVFSSDRPPEALEEIKISETNSFSGEDAFLLDRDNCPFKYFVFNSSREFERFGKDHGEMMMRQMYEGYKSTFGLDFQGSRMLEIHVLKSQDQYFRRQKDIGGSISQWGHYSLSRQEANLFFNRNMKVTMETFLHEVSHFLNHWSMESMPYWLNEGVATYIGNLSRQGESVVIKDNKRRNEMVRKYRRAGAAIPARIMFIIDPYNWKRLNGNGNQGYNTAYSLVQFMMEAGPARRVFLDALKLYSQGLGNQTTLLSLMEQEYPGGMEAFEEAWQAYYSRPSRPSHLFYRLPPLK